MQVQTRSSVAAITFWPTLPSASARAAEETSSQIGTNLWKSPLDDDSRWRIGLNSSYTASSTAKFQGTRLTDSDALNVNFSLGRRFSLSDQWFVRLDLGEENIFLVTILIGGLEKSSNSALLQ